MADSIAGFAGAIHRRRRLMTPEDRATYDDLLLEYGIQPPPATDEPDPVTQPRDKLLHRIVSERLWKNLLLLAPMILLPFFVVLQGSRSGDSPDSDMATDPVVLQQYQRTLFGCVGLQLLLAGQASLIVAIVRSWSVFDFGGRYRAYRATGILLSVFGVIGITVGYAHVPELITLIFRPLIGTLESSQKAVILVSVFGTVIFLFMSVIPDMGRNRVSQGLLCVGILTMLVIAVDSISVSLQFSAEGTRCVLLCIGSGMTLASLVLHCRFVTYVCNDPPTRRNPGTTSDVGAGAVAAAETASSTGQIPDSAGSGRIAEVVQEDRSESGTDAAAALEFPSSDTQVSVSENQKSSSRSGSAAKSAKEKRKADRKKAA